jgi:hypothetical protein
LHTEPVGHEVLEVQGGRHEPSTQSLPVVHCEALVQVPVDGRGRHRPLEHISEEVHWLSSAQPRTQALLMQ